MHPHEGYESIESLSRELRLPTPLVAARWDQCAGGDVTRATQSTIRTARRSFIPT